MTILSSLLSILANMLGIRRVKVEAAQSPAMQANAAALTDNRQADRSAGLIARALEGDEAALEQMRKEVSE